jgi:alanyl-tRNA synthetase
MIIVEESGIAKGIRRIIAFTEKTLTGCNGKQKSSASA